MHLQYKNQRNIEGEMHMNAPKHTLRKEIQRKREDGGREANFSFVLINFHICTSFSC